LIPLQGRFSTFLSIKAYGVPRFIYALQNVNIVRMAFSVSSVLGRAHIETQLAAEQGRAEQSRAEKLQSASERALPRNVSSVLKKNNG
jgi:hypothetical protein